jgi:hypothetical protein
MRMRGLSRSAERKAWRDMNRRCSNPLLRCFKNYGGRGISVCERWRVFENFFADMGPRPSPRHSLDRVNNDGNYEPGNVRWATMKEQARNKRTTRMLTYAGRTMPLIDWAAEVGMRPASVAQRLQGGMSVEAALSTPKTLRQLGEHTSQAKMTGTIVCAAREQYRAGGISMSRLAKSVGVHENTMREALMGITWGHIPNPITSDHTKRR